MSLHDPLGPAASAYPTFCPRQAWDGGIEQSKAITHVSPPPSPPPAVYFSLLFQLTINRKVQHDKKLKHLHNKHSADYTD